MYFSSVLLGSLFFSLLVTAQSSCTQEVPIHSIIALPSGILNITDEGGERQIKAMAFNTPDCQVNAISPTGQPFNENYTTLSQNGQNFDSCELNTVDDLKTFTSFQGIVVKTNGFPLDDISFTLDDVDSNTAGWQEAISVFGVRDGALIIPTIELNNVTHLKISNYKVPHTSLNSLGLGLDDLNVTGVETASVSMRNCPIQDVVKKQECGAKVHFSSPVDTIVILYALLSRGSTATRSKAFISALQFSCGCRCKETKSDTHTLTVPVAGLSGQCVRRNTSESKIDCDALGDQWCIKEDTTEYMLTGKTLPNGNLECKEKNGLKTVIQSPFTPSPGFGGTN